MNNPTRMWVLVLVSTLLCYPVFSWTDLSDQGRTFQISGQAVFTEDSGLSPSYPLEFCMTVMPARQNIVLGMTGHLWMNPYSLSLATLGVIAGIQLGNPRIRYRFLAGAQTPVGWEEGLGREPMWDIKVQSLLKFNQTLSWILEAGYLYTQNNLQKWSGPVLGTGFGIHF